MQTLSVHPAAAPPAAKSAGVCSLAAFQPCSHASAPRPAQTIRAARSGRQPVRAAAWGKAAGAESGGVVGGNRFSNKGQSKSGDMDLVDARQQVDIERLINVCHELQDKVEMMEGQLQQYEDRGRDRAVALRAILRDDKEMDKLLGQHEDGQLGSTADDQQEPWDSYRQSFTLLMSKGYLRTVECLRNRLMASEWELGLRPIALQTGVSRFEAYLADSRTELDFDTISELYDDPTDLRGIKDPFLRMRARSIIAQAEMEKKAEAWTACTAEAQRLASQFSEAEFISKIIPDPIEHGVVDALRKLVVPVTKSMGLGG